MAEEQDKREQDTKEIKADRERSRSRERRKRAGDRDFRARSRSRSRDRRRSRSPRGGRDRDRDRDRRRRSRSRSRSRSGDRDRKSHRSRRNRFDDDSGSGSDREERRKKAAAAAPAAGTFPGPPGGAAAAAAAADPFAALRAANPALAGLDPTAASMLMRQQMMLQQQLLLQQQAALQAQQVMSKAASSQTATAAQRQQEKLLKAQRELFVGNLAPGAVTEASLYQVFHSALIAAFPQAAQPGQEPVLRVTLSGRFAFVEFRAPEYATAALQLNGQIALMGNTLKIARPASYVETPAGGMLGGLGGAVAPAAVGGGVPGLPGGLPGAPAVPGVAPGGVAGVSDPLATAMPTPFLCLTGMVTAGVLADDEEFREGCAVAADLQQECSKYGAVLEVKIPRPLPGSAEQLFGTDHYGKAFVQFADVPSAQKAKDAIHGRLFAGSVVQAFHITLPSYQSIPAGIQQS